MAEEQKPIDGQEVVSPGIVCYVKCVSNKIDTVKDDIRSIRLNFDINVSGELVGKGNNLNINSLTPEGYAKLCHAFGVEEIDNNTPFCATLMTAATKELQEAWGIRMARKETKTDPDQSDVTDDPTKLKKRQKDFINDMIDQKVDADKVSNDFIVNHEVDDITELDREQASDLMEILKELEDKEAGEEVEWTETGNILVKMEGFPEDLAGGLTDDVKPEKKPEDKRLQAMAMMVKKPTKAQAKKIIKKLKELSNMDWEQSDNPALSQMFYCDRVQLNKEE